MARTWRKRNPISLLVGMQTGATTLESSTEMSQKLKMYLTFGPVISLLEIYLKKPETLIQKNRSTPVFIAALFIITEIWKQPGVHQ